MAPSALASSLICRVNASSKVKVFEPPEYVWTGVVVADLWTNLAWSIHQTVAFASMTKTFSLRRVLEYRFANEQKSEY